MSRLGRAIRRRVRTEMGAPQLPEAQMELLRLLRQRPGLRVQEVAQELRLARNTASTLATQLAAAGLLEKRSDPRDGRAGRLFLSRRAERRMDAWRERRRAILAGALGALPAAERDALGRALPSLQRLTGLLDGESRRS